MRGLGENFRLRHTPEAPRATAPGTLSSAAKSPRSEPLGRRAEAGPLGGPGPGRTERVCPRAPAAITEATPTSAARLERRFNRVRGGGGRRDRLTPASGPGGEEGSAGRLPARATAAARPARTARLVPGWRRAATVASSVEPSRVRAPSTFASPVGAGLCLLLPDCDLEDAKEGPGQGLGAEGGTLGFQNRSLPVMGAARGRGPSWPQRSPPGPEWSPKPVEYLLNQ